MAADQVSNKVIIVGAGVAGAALAYSLGKDGREVHVIERNLDEPNRIVGEVLQPGGYLKLIELGLEDCLNEIDAQRILGYCLHKGAKETVLAFPLEKYQLDVAGRAFHHGRFVQKMRQKSASLPNVKLEAGTVTSLIEEKGVIKGVLYRTSTGREMQEYAPLTIVCDGCFSTLRKFLCLPTVDKDSHFVGVVAENYQLPHPGYLHLTLAKPSNLIFYQISSNEVRFFIDINGSKLPSIKNGHMAHFLKTIVASQIPPEVQAAFISAVDKGDIRTMPNGYMPAKPNSIPGAVLVGDSLNMRHPMIGVGMTVALHDIGLLHNLLRPVRNLSDTCKLNAVVQLFYENRKPMAGAMNAFANIFYRVNCATYPSKEPEGGIFEIQQEIFNFLSIGENSKGPIALVSALNPVPLLVVRICIGFAMYSLGRAMYPVPSPKRIFAAVRMMLGAAIIIFSAVGNKFGVLQVLFARNAILHGQMIR